jgi:hypothetical protein
VRVRLKNPDSAANPGQLLFKPGMFARVKLPVKSKTMLSIPKDSLVLGESSPLVWVVEPESTAEKGTGPICQDGPKGGQLQTWD